MSTSFAEAFRDHSSQLFAAPPRPVARYRSVLCHPSALPFPHVSRVGLLTQSASRRHTTLPPLGAHTRRSRYAGSLTIPGGSALPYLTPYTANVAFSPLLLISSSARPPFGQFTLLVREALYAPPSAALLVAPFLLSQLSPLHPPFPARSPAKASVTGFDTSIPSAPAASLRG